MSWPAGSGRWERDSWQSRPAVWLLVWALRCSGSGLYWFNLGWPQETQVFFGLWPWLTFVIYLVRNCTKGNSLYGFEVFFKVILKRSSLVVQMVKKSAWNAGDLYSVPGLGTSLGEGNSYMLQYSGLENSMDCIVHGVTKSQTWLSDFFKRFNYF